MPIIKSAQKRMRQEATRRGRNVQTKQQMRSAVKAAEAAIASGKAKEATAALNEAFSKLDTAAKKNVIHDNKAGRLKARLHSKASAAGIKQEAGAKKTTKPAAKPATKKAPAKKAAPKTAAKKPATKTAAKKAPAKK